MKIWLLMFVNAQSEMPKLWFSYQSQWQIFFDRMIELFVLK